MDPYHGGKNRDGLNPTAKEFHPSQGQRSGVDSAANPAQNDSSARYGSTHFHGVEPCQCSAYIASQNPYLGHQASDMVPHPHSPYTSNIVYSGGNPRASSYPLQDTSPDDPEDETCTVGPPPPPPSKALVGWIQDQISGQETHGSTYYENPMSTIKSKDEYHDYLDDRAVADAPAKSKKERDEAKRLREQVQAEMARYQSQRGA
ncbi:hypothetical protein I302_107122 [Kwoniella bestiolae CBS 10118]|uniref:Uncharacterized protein n=1 Tax=Kwoniella bestiolae CBS 10118 TaxID=1296100 RepID=A0A1B9FZF3_9TREE|nr:hypothetical protein I302_05612 [Kwoniella bestiolae CBS 10118]OCF24153.1 hypothetical protein I302_05612 [Kwoniella bestiolae CBS 10118]